MTYGIERVWMSGLGWVYKIKMHGSKIRQVVRSPLTILCGALIIDKYCGAHFLKLEYEIWPRHV
jgi:hypothetical protein